MDGHEVPLLTQEEIAHFKREGEPSPAQKRVRGAGRTRSGIIAGRVSLT